MNFFQRGAEEPTEASPGGSVQIAVGRRLLPCVVLVSGGGVERRLTEMIYFNLRCR